MFPKVPQSSQTESLGVPQLPPPHGVVLAPSSSSQFTSHFLGGFSRSIGPAKADRGAEFDLEGGRELCVFSTK